MEEKVKVSVLISVYNPENNEYLLSAVNSIIGQTMQEWEMILYDDGSDEKYVPAIKKAASMDDRIRYVRGKSNRGLAYAMNESLRYIKGKYIARMDADDISHPDRFMRMYDFLEEHQEYQWVGCNACLIDKNGRWGVRRMPENPNKKDFLKYSPYIHPSVMFKAQVLKDCGGYKVTHRGEDYELFMRLHAEGLKGYNIQEELFSYREDENSYRRRKYRYQMEEVHIRFKGFEKLGILNIRTFPCAVKPLVVGLVPYDLLVGIKKKVRKEMYVERYGSSQTKKVS